MKSFLSGLAVGFFLGLIIGGVGVVAVLSAKAAPEDAVPELTLPAAPAARANELATFLDGHPYEVGFHARNLSTGQTLDRLGDRPVCLASTVKLFCLAELYRRVDADGLDLAHSISVPGHGDRSLEEAADLMIGLSDNAATDALAEYLGRDAIDALPIQLGVEGLSPEVLPSTQDLRRVLDKRIFADRVSSPGLPMHGTARAMVDFLTLLAQGEVVNAEVSDSIQAFLHRHPKPFTAHHGGTLQFSGKGGNILWTRPPRHYSMMGWALLVEDPSGDTVALCVWGEWFPESMPPDRQSEFLTHVSDSLLSILK